MTAATSLRVGGTGRLARRLAPLVDGAQACLARNIVPGRAPGRPARLPAGRRRLRHAVDAGQRHQHLAGRRLAGAGGREGHPADGARRRRRPRGVGHPVVGPDHLGRRRPRARPRHRRPGLGRAGLPDRRRDPRAARRALLSPSGLYRGPAVMADGITGYPPELHDPRRPGESFVLEHAATRDVRCLSTNALYVLGHGRAGRPCRGASGPTPTRGAGGRRSSPRGSGNASGSPRRTGSATCWSTGASPRSRRASGWHWPSSPERPPAARRARPSPASGTRPGGCRRSGRPSTATTSTTSDGTARHCGR